MLVVCLSDRAAQELSKTPLIAVIGPIEGKIWQEDCISIVEVHEMMRKMVSSPLPKSFPMPAEKAKNDKRSSTAVAV